MSKRDVLKFKGCAVAWQRALAEAGITLKDLSFAEVHDCFTIAELIEYEAMGLAGEGQGARVIAEGTVNKDGALPINPSGGLKAKGHPIGATGVSMHALAAMQLTGTAGGMQLKDPKLGGIFNMGGAAVANYVRLFERLRLLSAQPVPRGLLDLNRDVCPVLSGSIGPRTRSWPRLRRRPESKIRKHGRAVRK